MSIYEVESPIDLRNVNDASIWAAEVNRKRPWRYEFFESYVLEIKKLNIKNPKVLEVGSGPGYLAQVLLENLSHMSYTAIDFSEAMHQLSREHLGQLAHKATYLVADFKDSNWFDVAKQNRFDIVIIHQALHKLRHKAYAQQFHMQIKQNLLVKNGVYIVTDHLVADHGMKNNDLYMTIDEHLKALYSAGFRNIDILKEKNALCAFKIT